MQLFQFDIKALFSTLLFLIGGCGLSSQSEPAKMDLPMPKEDNTENVEKITQSKNVATVLLISDEEWYCYSDANMYQGKMYTQKEFQEWLVKKKKECGDSLLVLIKPSDLVTYKGTVDALDFMTVDNIRRFAMVKISPKEAEMFPSINIHNPSVLTPTEPTTVISASTAHYPAFVIQIRKDESVWYAIQLSKGDTSVIKVNEPFKNNLSKLIADFKRQHKRSINNLRTS